MDKKINLLSSVCDVGKVVTQVIIYKDNVKRTHYGILSETISQGEFTHFKKKDGRTIFVNTRNVLEIEVFDEGDSR